MKYNCVLFHVSTYYDADLAKQNYKKQEKDESKINDFIFKIKYLIKEFFQGVKFKANCANFFKNRKFRILIELTDQCIEK
ncbi:hypothetical protein BC952_0203 [Flavobacterium limicola]|uniref:Uncharacterized protein n=1 Tax=Flavobacterium limicola TaxID=180441 RepID=A0A495S624_9FLAO|nr:hypothetical protein BC952_0203 [Flavobacterium limicola]